MSTGVIKFFLNQNNIIFFKEFPKILNISIIFRNSGKQVGLSCAKLGIVWFTWVKPIYSFVYV